MKAVYAAEPYAIEIRDIPKPEPGPCEVLIKVEYTGICGSDLHAYRGAHAFRKPPVMLGHEVSGSVEAVGDTVAGFREGDKVTVMPQVGCGICASCGAGKTNLCTSKTVPGTSRWIGTFGEYFTAPQSVVLPLQTVSTRLGALTEPLAVANHVLSRNRDQRKDNTLVILGAGTIGLMMLMIAPRFGYENILITDVLDYNLDLARRFGAGRVVNVIKENPVEAVREYFGAEGAGTVAVAAGGADILEQAIAMARAGGSVLYFAMITREMTFNTYPIVFKELNLLGSFNYTMEDFRQAIEYLKDESIPLGEIITQEYTFAQAKEAFETLDKKTENSVKALFRNP